MIFPKTEEKVYRTITLVAIINACFAALPGKMGIGVVQEIAEETLKRKPGCTVKELMKILDQYLEQRNDQANTNE